MTPSKQIPLTGILPRASEPTWTGSPPVPVQVSHSPSTGLYNSETHRAKRLKAVSIIVSGRQTRICLPAVSTQVQGPFTRFHTLRCLVAHVINHMSGVTQGVGNIKRKLGIFIQGKPGRISNV